jgi:hypothetical protein
VVPIIRTYRAVTPPASISSAPPSPAAVEYALVQAVPSTEVSTEYAVACDASQVSTTDRIVAFAPRSSVQVCGSEKALDQRVAGSPSIALSGP